MSKVFYDHLTIREELTAQLNMHKLDPVEKEEIIDLIDQTLHHITLDIILTHLPKKHHREFMVWFHKAPYDESLLDFIQEKVSVDIRAEITSHAKQAKSEILTEIRRARRK